MSERNHHGNKNGKGTKTYTRGTFYTELVRAGHTFERKICRMLKRRYKLNKKNITRVKETVKQNAT